MLDSLIKSKTRLRLLVKFFISQANRGYLNGLATEMNESTNSIRKELNNLHDAGYLIKVKNDNKIEYQANIKHPMFDIIKKVIHRHLGIEEIIETVLQRMGNVKQIILVGDYAKGIDSGKIEAFLIGDDLDMVYITNLEEKVEKLINRKISFYLANKFFVKEPFIILFSNENR
jgi:predicted transcriptional regulator